MNIKNLLKVVAGIVGTILVGAIGSGVWERMLSPALVYASAEITNFLGEVSNTYSDSVYTSAASLYNPFSVRDVVAALFMITFSYTFFSAIRSKRSNKYVDAIYRMMILAFSGWVGIGYWGIFLAATTFSLARLKTVEEIQSYSQSKMEIVRPYVGEARYFHLRSDYLRIRSKADFDRFLVELDESFQEAKIPLEPRRH